MEWTAAAAKRLNQYAFLPSKKQKKYSDVHTLYLKAAHAYVAQAQQQHSAAVTSDLYQSAGDSFSSAALLATRKLRLPVSALACHIEAALCYQRAEEWLLACDSLKLVMETRSQCQHSGAPSASPSSSPAPGGLRLAIPPAAAENGLRKKNRRSSDAGPMRGEKSRASHSLPASPLLSSRTPPAVSSSTTPGSPQLQQSGSTADERTGVLRRMRQLMVRTGKEKDKDSKPAAAGATAGEGVSTDAGELSPLPPLTLPVAVSPPSPTCPAPTASAPFPAPPVHQADGAHVGKAAAAPSSTSAFSAAPLSSAVSPLDSQSPLLRIGHVPASASVLLQPQTSLHLAFVAAHVGYALWDDLQQPQALGCLEVALSLLSVLEDATACSRCPPPLLSSAQSALLLASNHAASFYLQHHAELLQGRPAYDCDIRLLQRARELHLNTARMVWRLERDSKGKPPQSEEETGTEEKSRQQLTAMGLSPSLSDAVLSFAPPSMTGSLFAACLCDAIIAACTSSFQQRVLFTPPLVLASCRLCPAFTSSSECRFVRQTYGLLQLSASAPARLLEPIRPSPFQPGAAAAVAASHSPEEGYRRLLLQLWGNEIMNEFVLLLTRFLLDKGQGGREGGEEGGVGGSHYSHYVPVSPTSAARERGDAGKVHPMLLLGGLCKDESEDGLVAAGQEAVGPQALQLIMRVKRIMQHNLHQPAPAAAAAAPPASTDGSTSRRHDATDTQKKKVLIA